jgi:pepF/M3 family oligoendopeptidase
MKFPLTWRLDTIYDVQSAKNDIARCMDALQQLPENQEKSLQLWQDIHKSYRELQTYAECLCAENSDNKEGHELSSLCIDLEAKLQELANHLDWQLNLDSTQELSYALEKRRSFSQTKMSKEKESVALDLSVNGYHSWYELYKIVIAKVRVTVEVQGISDSFSLGRLEKLFSHPNRAVREKAFCGLEAECQKQQELFAQMLRSIFGFRLKLYQNRNWQNPFFEALQNNNIEEKTLNAVWQAVSEKAVLFHRFLEKKAARLGVSKLSWFDLDAPIGIETDNLIYEEAAHQIINCFHRKSQSLAAFAEKALSNGWVDAELREKKAPGGFCATLPQSKESRIFLTYAESMQSYLVLAHELGHAYHNQLLFDLPEIEQLYPETIAEAASTFCELISFADTKEGRFDRAQRSCTFVLNMHARFLFEQSLTSAYNSGYVTAEMLSNLMIEAQKKAYGNMLEVYHPYFWISKLHFYLTDRPSYNFPYTVGYLIAIAIEKHAKHKPEDFDAWYQKFLMDSSRMSVEDIIKKYFNHDATKPDFWLEALDEAAAIISDL